MKLPLSLIKSFIEIDLPVAKISETLTLLGIEVDKVLNEQPSFARVVVAEVIEAKRHPNSDKLQIAQVNDGTEIHIVVCGASNCRAGMKTAFAKIGAILTDADGMQRRIEKTTIRGIESSGMLCAASELRIAEPSLEEGILELPEELETGSDAVSLLWDPVFEISLTPNLGHCMSALGIARELSAALQQPIHQAKPRYAENPKSLLENKIKVSIEERHLSSRYMCKLIEGVKIGPSPFWLKRQIEACGMKSINNAIDAVNYIMIRFGQPMHAFDYHLLEGKALTVSAAKKEQKFRGLDGAERTVVPGTIVISDAHKPVAIAGIMGGENSAVSSETADILLEAASFDPMAIRIASKKIGLRTESSQRFEKGVDPASIDDALQAACELIIHVCGGQAAHGTIDIKAAPLLPKELICRPDRVNQILGTKLSAHEMKEIFQRLQFKTLLLEKGELRVTVPSYRFDISEEIDLVEEIARIYGYNNIDKSLPRCTTSQIPHDPDYLFEKEFRSRLLRQGLQEFLTCDLISPQMSEMFKEILSPSVTALQTIYSKSEEYSILRTSLLPGLLEVSKKNLDQRNQNLSVFEIGRIHFFDQEHLTEIPMGAILLSGKNAPPHWSQKQKDSDFFDLKGLVENLLNGLKIEHCHFQPSQHLCFHPGRQADIQVNGLVLGSLGEVHPQLLGQCDIKQRVLYAELNLQNLLKERKTQTKMVQLPQFPSSERDWTIALDISIPIDSIFKKIESVDTTLLETVELIDLYTPENSLKKNATFRLVYRDRLKTISFEEVEAEHAKILQTVTKSLAL